MKENQQKTSGVKGAVLLLLALAISLCAAGATWAHLREITDRPTVNHFAEAVEYVLSYNANGGTGSIDDLVYVTNDQETSHTFTLGAGQLTAPENTEFLGWAESADATAPDYLVGDTITLTIDAPKKTLYAVWGTLVDPSDFYLEFDANVPVGVKASVSTPLAMEKRAPAEVYYFKVSNPVAFDYNVKDTGLRFMGWSTGEFGDVVYPYTEGDWTISVPAMPGQVTKLYAVWEFDYYITFERNAPAGAVEKYKIDGGSYSDDGAAITVMTNHKNVSVFSTCVDSGYMYRRTDYMLLGFGTAADSTKLLQNVEIPKAGINNALKVYALWETGTFGLIYDANGGESAPAADIKNSTADSYTFTVTATAPSSGAAVEANFLGWADDPDATVPDYKAGDKINVSTLYPSKTIFAVWEYTYRLNFDMGHATGGGVPAEIVIGPTTDKQVTITVPATPTPERDAYFFDYWAATEERVDGEHRYYDVANYSRQITLYADDTNLTLYARMAPTEGVVLQYSANGGSGAPSQQKQNLNTQDFCVFKISTTIPTRSNYTFMGWAYSSSTYTPVFTAEQVRAGECYVTIDGDETPSLTLYAVWKSYDRMRVYIDFNGGSYSKTSGSGCNATTTTYRNRTGSYEYITPGSTTHSFEMVTFEKNGLTNLYFPSRSGYSVAGFAYVNDEGRLTADITMQDSSLCTSGGVKGFKWSQASQNAGTQTVVVDKQNADGSYDYTLYSYIIWAKNAAQDKYQLTLKQNHNATSTDYSFSKTQYVKQVQKEASGNDPAVINTSYTFSSVGVSDIANSRTGYKLLGFARTPDATTPQYTVSGTTIQGSITVSQDDSDVVLALNQGSDGGHSYTLTLYAVWERQHKFKVYVDHNGGSYYNTDSQTSYTSYNWVSQRALSESSCSWTSLTLNGTPIRSGFNLLGYARTPNATEAEFTVSSNVISPGVTVAIDGEGVVKSTSSDNVDTYTLTLYAVWEKLQFFSLTVDFNGGTYTPSSGSTMTEETISRTAKVDVTQYTWASYTHYTPSRNGYKLLGLASTPDATEPEYTISSSKLTPDLVFDKSVLSTTTNSNGVETTSMTLYCVWKQQRRFYLYGNANGGYLGTDTSVTTSGSYREVNTDITQVTWTAGSMNFGGAKRAGHKLLGYAYTADATVPDFPVDSSGYVTVDIVVDENSPYVTNNTTSIPNTTTLKIYAVWQPLRYFRIRLDLGQGSYTPTSGTSGNEILIASNAVDPETTSYTFTNPNFTASSGPYRSNHNIQGYTDVYGGTTNVLPALTSAESGSYYKYTFSNTTVKVEEGAPGVEVTVDADGITYVTKTYYPIYYIYLDYYNYQPYIRLERIIRYYPTDADRVFDISATAPTYKSFKFAGWSASATSTVPEYGIQGTYIANSNADPLTETVSVTGSYRTLYAVWWQEYTLAFSANGGIENTTPNRASAHETLAYNATATTHTFTIDGTRIPVYDAEGSRTFLGWSTDPNATDGVYMPGDNIVVAGDSTGGSTATTLYAIWSEPVTTGDAPAADVPSGDDPTEVTSATYELNRQPEVVLPPEPEKPRDSDEEEEEREEDSASGTDTDNDTQDQSATDPQGGAEQ